MDNICDTIAETAKVEQTVLSDASTPTEMPLTPSVSELTEELTKDLTEEPTEVLPGEPQTLQAPASQGGEQRLFEDTDSFAAIKTFSADGPVSAHRTCVLWTAVGVIAVLLAVCIAAILPFLQKSEAVMLYIDETAVGYVVGGQDVDAALNAVLDDLRQDTALPFEAQVPYRCENASVQGTVALLSSDAIYDVMYAQATEGYVRAYRLFAQDGSINYAFGVMTEAEILSAVDAAIAICCEQYASGLPSDAVISAAPCFAWETAWIAEDAVLDTDALISRIVDAQKTEINAQINSWYLIIFLVFILIVTLILISGTVYINSIVKPIREINETARMIADGNYDARIDHYLYKDEIGDLCDTINNMAERIKVSDKIKNDFISTVSHELRTPLTAIKGWGETLLQIGDTDPSLMQRGMGVIISESSRLNGIVEELLDFSRMQSGRMTLKIEKMDILAELDETVFAFKDRSMREGIELIYNAPDLPAPMDGDSDRIKQVFVNILDNALKYTKQGGKIVISAKIKDDRITVVVSDTGCGISADDLPHVKEKFYKTNMTVHGSGIGLAVVDEIIRMHNGTFDIDSVLGEGTTVTVSFDIDHIEIENLWDIDAAIAKENEKKSMEEDEDVGTQEI